MKRQPGFILIELITVIVLVAIIASFSTFFLYSGINGYLNIKNRTDGAIDAQMALDRISLELRDLNDFTSFTPNLSLTYTNEVLSGTRRLSYHSNTIWLSIGADDYTLLENVDPGSFILAKILQDLDNDTFSEVAYFEVGFSVNSIGQGFGGFSTKIFPRHMVNDK